MAGTEHLGETAQPLDHKPDSTPRGNHRQSHTFVALIRLSTTMQNLLMFNTSEISSNSEKLSLLADKHL